MKRRIARAITRGQARIARAARRSGGRRVVLLLASCFWTSLSISFWRFCRTRLTM